MDRGSNDLLEDELRRGLDRAVHADGGSRPPFAEIARRGRRRERRRRGAALAGVGVAGVLAGALTWRVGATPDGDTTTVSVATVPEVEPVAVTEEQKLLFNLDVMDEWASEPVPAGCEAFVATHPEARGLREVAVGESIAGPGRSIAPAKHPYEGPGAHFSPPEPDEGLSEIVGDDGTVLHRKTDPAWTFGPELAEAGGWVYFMEVRMLEAPVGVAPDHEYVLRRVPSAGGAVEVVPGSPPGGNFTVSPDGRWLTVQTGYALPTSHLPHPTALTVVDLASGAIHELAIDGEATGSTWGPVWADDGALLISTRFEDFGMDCRTGQLMGPMFPGPSEAGQYAVDLNRMSVYRVDPSATSLTGAEVVWPR